MSFSSSSSSDANEVPRAFEQLRKSHQLIQSILEKRQQMTEDDQTRRRRRTAQRSYIERNRIGGAAQLMADYFGYTPTYGDAIFRHQFRMSRDLFLHIVEALEARDPFFTQRPDALGKPSFTAIQKCTAAVRQLGNGCPADHLDEYLRMGESTTIDCLKRFCRSMVSVFGGNYLRKPDATYCGRLLPIQFTVDVNGIAPPIQFTANRRPYNMAYYLTDGIYPKLPVFISSPTAAADPKVQLFKTKQESARKDVEMAFGVLKMRWGIIQGPSRLYFRNHMQDVMYACIIMHNMIIENEGPMVTQWAPPEDEASSSNGPTVERGGLTSFREYVERSFTIRDSVRHGNLINNLIEELWTRNGREN